MKLYLISIILFTMNCVSTDVQESQSKDGKFARYLNDRAMDFRDILTITGSVGFLGGVKGQIGPAGIGLYGESGGEGHSITAIEYGLRNGEFGMHNTSEMILIANKTSSKTYGGNSESRCKNFENSFKHIPSYTRIGFGLGLIVGLKVELNIGELADFLLGLFLIDLYKDDVYLNGEYLCNK